MDTTDFMYIWHTSNENILHQNPRLELHTQFNYLCVSLWIQSRTIPTDASKLTAPYFNSQGAPSNISAGSLLSASRCKQSAMNSDSSGENRSAGRDGISQSNIAWLNIQRIMRSKQSYVHLYITYLRHFYACAVLVNRVLPGRALHDNQPQAPYITRIAVGLVADAFRWHVLEGAHERAAHGYGALQLRWYSKIGYLRHTYEEICRTVTMHHTTSTNKKWIVCNVTHLHLSLWVYQQIWRLYVAMNTLFVLEIR